MGVLNPVDGIVTHANHFEALPTVHDTLRDFGSASFFRSARARRLFGGSSDRGKGSPAVLADHGGYPQSICRHDADALTEDDRSESLYAVVLDLDERRMSIAAGPSCQADTYHEIRLNGLFG